MNAESLQSAGGPPPTGACVLEEISRTVVRLHKEYTGRGPDKARTYIIDDLVVCVLRGGFTIPDRTLVQHGEAALVMRQRHALAEALRQPLIDAVEPLVGRKVIAFTSGIQPDGEVSTEVFLLE
jgi:uncharacterized protein YbcI